MHPTRSAYYYSVHDASNNVVFVAVAVPVVVDIGVVLVIKEPRLYSRTPAATLLKTTTMVTAAATHCLNRQLLRYNAMFFRFKLYYKQFGCSMHSLHIIFAFELVTHKMTNCAAHCATDLRVTITRPTRRLPSIKLIAHDITKLLKLNFCLPYFSSTVATLCHCMLALVLQILARSVGR